MRRSSSTSASAPAPAPPAPGRGAAGAAESSYVGAGIALVKARPGISPVWDASGRVCRQCRDCRLNILVLQPDQVRHPWPSADFPCPAAALQEPAEALSMSAIRGLKQPFEGNLDVRRCWECLTVCVHTFCLT